MTDLKLFRPDADHQDVELRGSTATLEVELQRRVQAGTEASVRALARMYAALANGGQLTSPDRITTASAPVPDTPDAWAGHLIRHALGYSVGGLHDREFGHSGAGGTLGWAVPDHRFAFALAKNNLTADPIEPCTTALLIREVRTALAIPA